tara:strand:+ start:495 stop:956 length:462 start_codon:yes stop_codon:yes gene_type:complete
MARTAPKPKIDKAGGTQPAATSPDVVYGQGQQNIEAQNQIGLPDNRGMPTNAPASQPVLQGPQGIVSAGAPQASPDALEAARMYNPQTMAMNAADDDPILDITAGLYRTLDSAQFRQDQKVTAVKNRLLEGLADAESEVLQSLGSHIKSRQTL